MPKEQFFMPASSNIENESEKELQISAILQGSQKEFFRSGGHGGQNVNKVESGARLRISIVDEKLLSRLRDIYPSFVTVNGELIVERTTQRSQKQNLEEAYDGAKEMLMAAMEEPKERRATKVPRREREARKKEKRKKSEIKRMRSAIKEF